MRRFWGLLILFALTASLFGCAGEKGESVEIYMLNVGKGDAIILMTGGKVFLIDAAKPERWGVLQSAFRELGISRLDGVFVTHADGDHVGGLEPLARSGMEIGAWYASGYCVEYKKEEKHPAVRAAALRGQTVEWLYAGDSAEGIFQVLAPGVRMEDKEDNNSLVMAVSSAAGRALLTGDMEIPEEAELLSRAGNLQCAVLKVPNHGDDDTLSAQMVAAAAPEIALISTDPYEKPGTPDEALLARLRAVGAEVFRTDMSEMGIHVILDENGARAEYAVWQSCPESLPPLTIDQIDAENDTVRVRNLSDSPIALDGCYLFSDRGEELFAFPRDTRLPAGAAVTVGTRSTDGAFDLLWDDKNVIHNSKSDTVTLYDPYGRAISAAENGF